ncbi:MAG: ACP S-malonyltransferase [Saprospiraceae bacterium]
MKAFVFPGQGAQFEGMGFDLFETSDIAKRIFHQADEILGFSLSEVMFKGSAEDLKQTRITQPALFVHAMAKWNAFEHENPDAVAGHSLGEFSALVANQSLSFEDGLRLVYERALAMQEACEKQSGTMAAVLGLEDEKVEEICGLIMNVVVPANYNCPGQLVISGSIEGIQEAITKLTEAGARRALVLEVGGAFHSPLMEPARLRLEKAIQNTTFNTPICPVFQNIHGQAELNPEAIKINLIAQLTGAVKWTQSIQNMISSGIDQFVEVGGSGKVLSGLIKKINKDVEVSTL